MTSLSQSCTIYDCCMGRRLSSANTATLTTAHDESIRTFNEMYVIYASIPYLLPMNNNCLPVFDKLGSGGSVGLMVESGGKVEELV